ncbi:MAG: cell division protein FtsL [Deltaproteobacteria bacterium RBG_16_44_11]|nr:MAG: cell division protein FtsL [Deltaproteobacteria bacterium RBG_16_44_11]
MAHAVGTQVIPRIREMKKTSFGIKYSTFIVVSIVLMFIALIYVGSHIRMTELEYNVAAQLSEKEQKLEEQKKLTMELAMLKSPQRIEGVARNKLHMSYPESNQVIVLKNSGE